MRKPWVVFSVVTSGYFANDGNMSVSKENKQQ